MIVAVVVAAAAAPASPLRGSYTCGRAIVSYETDASRKIVYFRVTNTGQQPAEVDFGYALHSEDGGRREASLEEGPHVRAVPSGKTVDAPTVAVPFNRSPLSEIRIDPIAVHVDAARSSRTTQNTYCLTSPQVVP